MQIVIDIPEKEYELTLCGEFNVTMTNEAVKNGKVLPKGHGRLIDADKLATGCDTADDYCNEGRDCNSCKHRIVYKKDIDDAPTIIEADKEVADE